MREQTAAGVCGRSVFAWREHDVMAGGERTSGVAPCQLAGVLVGMNTHGPEITAEARLEERARLVVQGLSATQGGSRRGRRRVTCRGALDARAAFRAGPPLGAAGAGLSRHDLFGDLVGVLLVRVRRLRHSHQLPLKITRHASDRHWCRTEGRMPSRRDAGRRMAG